MAPKFKDYYETLGVPRSASPDAIKQAFRKLARLHHPDVAKNKAAGEAKFKEINEAYEVLGDPEKRRRYDELGAQWSEADQGPAARSGARPPPRRGQADFEFGGTGFSDFFESFFGRDGGSAYGPGGHPFDDEESGDAAGRDVEADLMVTLEEALKGSRRKITLRRTTAAGERVDSYQVRIPPGVLEGQRIRLAGQGNAGFGGRKAGDLYLRVHLARHPDFTVQGADLYRDLDLAPWEAALGVGVKIPALDGLTTLHVPAGTTTGSQLRLRGLGLPRENGGRGDLYAVARVQVPASATDEERALWKQLARVCPFRPRDPA